MAIIAILFAAPSDAQGWSKLKSSWSDDSEVEIARIIPSLSDTRWGAASGFDDRSLPSSSQPDLRAWLRPSEGSRLNGLRAIIRLAESQRDGYHAIHHSARRLPFSSPTTMTLDDTSNALMKVKGMLEKPAADKAPSAMAVIGRYILTPAVFETLNSGLEGAGEEIQLTDVIAAQIGAFNNVHGYRFEGKRFDCGSKAGFLQATVAFGLSREELRDEFLEYLHETVALRKAAEWRRSCLISQGSWRALIGQRSVEQIPALTEMFAY